MLQLLGFRLTKGDERRSVLVRQPLDLGIIAGPEGNSTQIPAAIQGHDAKTQLVSTMRSLHATPSLTFSSFYQIIILILYVLPPSPRMLTDELSRWISFSRLRASHLREYEI